MFCLFTQLIYGPSTGVQSGSQGMVSCSVSSRQIDEHTGWRATSPPARLLALFWDIKNVVSSQGLAPALCSKPWKLSLCLQWGCPCSCKADRLLPAMRNGQLDTWTRLMHGRDVIYRGVRVLSCFQCHSVVLGVLAAFTWGGVTPSCKHLFHWINHPHLDTNVSSTCEWRYEIHYDNFWKAFAVSF